MDFDVPEELAMLVDSVRRFRERELMPLEQRFLLDGSLEPDTRTALELKAKDQGFWALGVPEEYGGGGLSQLGSALVAEELYKHPAMFDFGGEPEPALYHCTDEQKVKWFYPIIEGEKRSAYAFTEPGSGSDIAGLETTAKRDGDNWIINGSKMFISFVTRADFIILFATVDRSAGTKGVTCFLVEKGTPGFEVARSIPTMGDDWEPHELVFTDCVVSDDHRLGEVGEGWKIVYDQLTHGRVKIAAYQLGMAQRSIDIAIEWASERSTWGKKIASRQAIQWMVADSLVELEAARMLTYRAAVAHDNHEPNQMHAFMAKLYATEMAQRVTDRCMQILGGLGYSKELPVQSFYRQARVWRIGHGTSEIHRWMIARDALGESAKD
jgi:alkylation response protein AidB-like acyl-CoA dehydrogenase